MIWGSKSDAEFNRRREKWRELGIVEVRVTDLPRYLGGILKEWAVQVYGPRKE